MSSAAIIMAQVISAKSPMVPAEDTGLVENRDYKLLLFCFLVQVVPIVRVVLATTVISSRYTPCTILTSSARRRHFVNEPQQT